MPEITRSTSAESAKIDSSLEKVEVKEESGRYSIVTKRPLYIGEKMWRFLMLLPLTILSFGTALLSQRIRHEWNVLLKGEETIIISGLDAKLFKSQATINKHQAIDKQIEDKIIKDVKKIEKETRDDPFKNHGILLKGLVEDDASKHIIKTLEGVAENLKPLSEESKDRKIAIYFLRCGKRTQFNSLAYEEECKKDLEQGYHVILYAFSCSGMFATPNEQQHDTPGYWDSDQKDCEESKQIKKIFTDEECKRIIMTGARLKEITMQEPYTYEYSSEKYEGKVQETFQKAIETCQSRDRKVQETFKKTIEIAKINGFNQKTC